MFFVQQTWDTDLAQQADTYAKECIWAHPADLKVGQNLYLGTADVLDVVYASQAW